MIWNANNCILRSWRPEDLEPLLRHANNPRIAAQLRDRFPHPYTRSDGQAWLALATQQQPETSFVIEVQGELVGSIGLIPGIDIERVSAEVGYWLGETVWGRGIATAALTTFSQQAFSHFNLSRLFAVPFARNLASCRVLEKAGYSLVGLLRRSAIKNGEILDQALYQLVRD